LFTTLDRDEDDIQDKQTKIELLWYNAIRLSI